MSLKEVEELPLLAAATPNTYALVQDAGVTQKLGVSGLLRQYDVTSAGVSPSNSGAQNDAALPPLIVAALAEQAELYWPPGAYTFNASIANLHSVRHRGPGRIVRGADTFYVEPKAGQQNTLYVAASGGSLTNDGLSASQPISTVQKAMDSWAQYAPATEGDWKLKLAAGTFTEGGVIDGVVSPTVLVIEGTLLAGAPDTFIDGSGATAQNGLNFNDGVRVYVKNIECRDWTTTPGESCGFIVQNGSLATFETCRGSGNSFCDFNCTEFSDMNFVGAIRGSSLIGARYYRLSHGSVGDGTNLVDFTGSDAGGSIGLLVRDGSSVVCNDGVTLSDRNYGAYIWKTGSYLELRDATVSSCAVGVYIDGGWYANSGGTQTMVGNGRDHTVRGRGMNQDNSRRESQYDAANVRWCYGADTEPSTFPLKFLWSRDNSAISGSQYNGNAWAALDGNGATNYIALSGPTNHTSGLLWCDPAVSAAAWFYYNIGGSRFRWAIAGTERYSLDATGFFPLDNNARDLGSSSLLWEELWVNNVRANGTGVAFNGTAPIAKPTVTGSRGGNAALASLLTQLAALGLITDSSS